jgi:hypothetical protein
LYVADKVKILISDAVGKCLNRCIEETKLLFEEMGVSHEFRRELDSISAMFQQHKSATDVRVRKLETDLGRLQREVGYPVSLASSSAWIDSSLDGEGPSREPPSPSSSPSKATFGQLDSPRKSFLASPKSSKSPRRQGPDDSMRQTYFFPASSAPGSPKPKSSPRDSYLIDRVNDSQQALSRSSAQIQQLQSELVLLKEELWSVRSDRLSMVEIANRLKLFQTEFVPSMNSALSDSEDRLSALERSFVMLNDDVIPAFRKNEEQLFALVEVCMQNDLDHKQETEAGGSNAVDSEAVTILINKVDQLEQRIKDVSYLEEDIEAMKETLIDLCLTKDRKPAAEEHVTTPAKLPENTKHESAATAVTSSNPKTGPGGSGGSGLGAGAAARARALALANTNGVDQGSGRPVQSPSMSSHVQPPLAAKDRQATKESYGYDHNRVMHGEEEDEQEEEDEEDEEEDEKEDEEEEDEEEEGEQQGVETELAVEIDSDGESEDDPSFVIHNDSSFNLDNSIVSGNDGLDHSVHSDTDMFQAVVELSNKHLAVMESVRNSNSGEKSKPDFHSPPSANTSGFNDEELEGSFISSDSGSDTDDRLKRALQPHNNGQISEASRGKSNKVVSKVSNPSLLDEVVGLSSIRALGKKAIEKEKPASSSAAAAASAGPAASRILMDDPAEMQESFSRSSNQPIPTALDYASPSLSSRGMTRYLTGRHGGAGEPSKRSVGPTSSSYDPVRSSFPPMLSPSANMSPGRQLSRRLSDLSPTRIPRYRSPARQLLAQQEQTIETRVPPQSPAWSPGPTTRDGGSHFRQIQQPRRLDDLLGLLPGASRVSSVSAPRDEFVNQENEDEDLDADEEDEEDDEEEEDFQYIGTSLVHIGNRKM